MRKKWKLAVPDWVQERIYKRCTSSGCNINHAEPAAKGKEEMRRREPSSSDKSE